MKCSADFVLLGGGGGGGTEPNSDPDLLVPEKLDPDPPRKHGYLGSLCSGSVATSDLHWKKNNARIKCCFVLIKLKNIVSHFFALIQVIADR